MKRIKRNGQTYEVLDENGTHVCVRVWVNYGTCKFRKKVWWSKDLVQEIKDGDQ